MPFTMPNFDMPSQPELGNPLSAAVSGLLAGVNAAPTLKKNMVDAKYEALTAQANAAYKQAMAQYLTNPNQALKGLTPVGKSFLEPAVIKATLARQGKNISDQDAQGIADTYNNPQGTNGQQAPTQTPIQSPVDPDAITNAYNLYRQKQTSDTDTRKRTLFATNIEKTMGFIDPDALTKYGGIEGTLEKGTESIKSAFGKESPDYDNYVKSANAVKMLVKQVRQFYGDSIQPSMQANLEFLANPSNWKTNPKLAKDLWTQFSQVLSNETQTYKGALQSTKPYKENVSLSSQNNYEYNANGDNTTGNPQDVINRNAKNNLSPDAVSKHLKNKEIPEYSEGKVPPQGTRWMSAPDGKIYAVHESNISDVKKPPYNMKEVE